jgi:hypothetical protein
MVEKVYFVQVPMAGIVSKYFKANSEKEAIKKALEDTEIFEDLRTKNGWELEKWDLYRHLFKGNIDYSNLSSAVATESDEYDPEDLE